MQNTTSPRSFASLWSRYLWMVLFVGVMLVSGVILVGMASIASKICGWLLFFAGIVMGYALLHTCCKYTCPH